MSNTTQEKSERVEFSREREPIGCVDKEVSFKELAHTLMGSDEPRILQSRQETQETRGVRHPNPSSGEFTLAQEETGFFCSIQALN